MAAEKVFVLNHQYLLHQLAAKLFCFLSMKSSSRIFQGFLFVGIVWLLASTSCRYREPCDSISEPYCSINMDYYGSQMVPYEKVYLPQRIQPNAYYNLATTDSLPFSVVSDTTIYVFESPTRRDTVGIGYTRDIRYQATDCGIVITLSNLRILPFTTIPAEQITLETSPRTRGWLFGQGPKITTYTLSILP